MDMIPLKFGACSRYCRESFFLLLPNYIFVYLLFTHCVSIVYPPIVYIVYFVLFITFCFQLDRGY